MQMLQGTNVQCQWICIESSKLKYKIEIKTTSTVITSGYSNCLQVDHLKVFMIVLLKLFHFKFCPEFTKKNNSFVSSRNNTLHHYMEAFTGVLRKQYILKEKTKNTHRYVSMTMLGSKLFLFPCWLEIVQCFRDIPLFSFLYYFLPQK